MINQTLHDLICGKKSTLSLAPAFVYNGVTLSYQTFFQLVDNAEKQLIQVGVEAGSFVGTTIASPVIFLCAMLALSRRHAAIVPIDANGSEDFKRQVVVRHRIRVMITDAQHRAGFESVGCRVVVADNLVFSAAQDSLWRTSIVLDAHKLPCFVGFSSGTTGMPKSAVFSASAMLARVAKAEHYGPGDRLLVAFAPTSAFGAVYALRILSDRATLAFPSASDAQTLIRSIQSIEPTHLVATPAILTNLYLALKDLGTDAQKTLQSLKSVIVGGSTISPEVVEWVRTKAGLNLMSLYGSTEDGRIATADQDLLLARPGIAGRILSFIKAEVVGPDGQPLPEGQTGRLRFKTPYPAERLISEERVTTLDADTWSYPGDLGRILGDELYVVGRVDDTINLGGTKIDPAGIESQLCHRLGVREAAVVPFINPVDGLEQLGALVVDDKVRQAKALLDDFNAAFQLALSSLYVVEALPKNERGKLMRDAAKHQFYDLLSRGVDHHVS